MKCLKSSCVCYIPKACLKLGIHGLRAFRLISVEQKQELLSGLQKKPGEDSHESDDSPDSHNQHKHSTHKQASVSVVD